MLTKIPVKGERVAWRMNGELKYHATVLRTENNLCWIKPDDGSDMVPFIWRFKEGLNKLAEIVN